MQHKVRCFLMVVLLMVLTPALAAPDLSEFKLPSGFHIKVWANLDNPRALTYANGFVYAGSFGAGNVYAIPVKNDYSAGTVVTLAKQQSNPVGVTVDHDTLYFSAVSQIKYIPNISAVLKDKAPLTLKTLPLDLPSNGAHGWKFIAFGPDGWLYIPQGAPCNICKPDENKFAMIGRYNLKTGEYQTWAKGIRNSVGFTWNPKDNTLWATSNNRDWMGDDLPPDVLLHAPKQGLNFGYPYCHAGTVSDPEFGHLKPCSAFAPTAQALGAHVAPLGLRFYQAGQFPKTYSNKVFIAEHGSWNRSKKAGYRISMVSIDQGKASHYQPFIEGWLDNEFVSGRPADLQFLPDGSLLISDDSADVIYRVTYQP